MMGAEFILEKLQGVKPAGEDRWQARCPAHSDTNPSLTITAKSDRILLHCQAGCGYQAVVAAIGLQVKDLFADKSGGNGGSHASARETGKRTSKAAAGDLGEMVATYDYTDAAGNLLYQVCRFTPKTFRQRRPDPAGKDGWTWSLAGVQRVLYRLPEVLVAVAVGEIIFICSENSHAASCAGSNVTLFPSRSSLLTRD